MGLTLIRKSDRSEPRRNPKVALVLAGGAVSGGAFKVGGLKALDDFFVERRITDLDLYVGLSAGAILASSHASGVTPDEMIKVLDGTSTRLDQLRPIDFYNPNVREFAERLRVVQRVSTRELVASDTPPAADSCSTLRTHCARSTLAILSWRTEIRSILLLRMRIIIWSR